MRLILILAIDKHGCIAKDNDMPWKLKDDLKHFKNVTMDCPIIMGRKTYDTLPGILPGREHIVLSKQLESNKDISVFTDINEVMDYLSENDVETAFVIGGSTTIKQFCHLKLIDEYYLTEVDTTVQNGEIYVDIDEDLELYKWIHYKEQIFEKNENNSENYKIRYYIKEQKRFY